MTEVIVIEKSQIEKLLKDLLREELGNYSLNCSKITATKKEVETLLTISEASHLLHLTVPTLYGYVNKLAIPHYRKSKRLYFIREELIEWVKAGRRKTLIEIEALAQNHVNGKGMQKTFSKQGSSESTKACFSNKTSHDHITNVLRN